MMPADQSKFGVAVTSGNCLCKQLGCLIYGLALSEFTAHRPQGVEDARQSLWSQEARLAAGMPPTTSARILEAVAEYL